MEVWSLPFGFITAGMLPVSVHPLLTLNTSLSRRHAYLLYVLTRTKCLQEVVLPPPVRLAHQSFTWSNAVPLNLSSGGIIVIFSAKYQSFGLVLSLTLKPYSKSVKFFIMGKLLFTMVSSFPLSW